MRPYIEVATPSAYQWSTASGNIALSNAGNELVGIEGASLSAALDDVELELLLTTDVGKLKKKHMLTCVTAEINPIISGDNIKHGDDINTIKNPSGCVILSGADAGDTTKVPKYEITKMEPAAIGFTADDDRIAWRIHGGDGKANNKYDGDARFMNTEPSKRGTKIQVHGQTTGDVLIEPYSGAYGYGMIRAHVIPIQQIKYRVTRVVTSAQAAKPAVPAQPALPAQIALPATATLPAVPALAAVPARPAQPAVVARAAHVPTCSHAETKLHMKISNIFLRQIGVEMIPDNSVAMVSPVRMASSALPAQAAQPALAPQAAVPASPGVSARPAVPARPAFPAAPAIPAVTASVASTTVGTSALDSKVIKATRVSPGHFDVEVDDVNLTFTATSAKQTSSVQLNARNEVVSVAYMASGPGAGGGGAITLSTAYLCPVNHAPLARASPPRAYTTAAYTMTDLGTPSSSLIPKTGIPADTPADPVKMIVLFPDVTWQGTSPATRDTRLLWGIGVPTADMDSAVAAPTTDKIRLMYGYVFAHEMGHILGLGHRGATANPVTDGLALPANENVMRPFANPPTTENFDIIQTKAVRFSEVMFRTP